MRVEINIKIENSEKFEEEFARLVAFLTAVHGTDQVCIVRIHGEIEV